MHHSIGHAFIPNEKSMPLGNLHMYPSTP